ncbi:MAG: hypothetical protein AAF384_19905 [Pseudomonadota bacterium]
MSSSATTALLLCASAAIASVSAGAAEVLWRPLENIADGDRALFDPATNTPRDSAIAYIPAEPYPFTAPYTAEEMGYRSAEFVHLPRWSSLLIDVFGVITPSGYINQGASISYANLEAAEGFQGYIQAQAGEVYTRWMVWDVFPPENEGTQQYWTPYRTDAEFRTKMDFFIYSPQLRRVRRQPEPRRDQRFPDNSQTFDDVIGRDPWEWHWELIGTDVLFETVRFPNTRPTITWNDAIGGFFEQSTSDIKIMGAKFPHYRGDGGLDCWVVKATAKNDWLPDYGEKHLVLWLEKNTFYPVRREKYGHDGRLITVEARLVDHLNPAKGDFGYGTTLTVYWNVDHDLIGFSLHDSQIIKNWSDEEKAMIFNAEFMRRQWKYEPLKTQTRIEAPDQFFMRPLVYPEKFPQHRNPTLPGPIDARYQAQEGAGRLVFESSSAAAQP